MSASSDKGTLKAKDEGQSMRSVLSSSNVPRSPGSGTMKAVQIADPPESISPLMQGSSKDIDDFNLDRSVPRQHRTKISSSRMTGRPPMPPKDRSSRNSVVDTPMEAGADSSAPSRPSSLHDAEGLASRITAWIEREKHRRSKRRSKRRHHKKKSHHEEEDYDHSDASSEGSTALDALQDILNRSLSVTDRPTSRKGFSLGAKKPSRAKLRRQSGASESEFIETEDQVPTCDVILDNTKVCSSVYDKPEAFSDTEDDGRPSLNRSASSYQKDAWKSFKYEIVRLTHTLRMKGWRRVPMQMSNQIEVIRLSGALTNAVYEVLPPNELPAKTTDTVDGTSSSHPKSKPQKLLLRIYGVGVENLIDREAELQILRRLRRKNVGPRLLGCFQNGRFEEFLAAKPLTAQEMRDPTTSGHIAKRIRELHEGMDLLPLEREEGSFTWCSVNRWQKQCGPIVEWLDKQAKENEAACADRPLYVCGTEWATFSAIVDKYRAWLFEQYGGVDKLKEHLVFAHNDTQYGNILRMTAEGDSPLLTPANQHKRLQVIDFEYANANMQGYEFANHFVEWCYNYHDEEASHACNAKKYPTWEEQRRFIQAYLTHDPKFGKSTDTASAQQSGPATPALGPSTSSLSTSLISNFMLDARAPPGGKDGQNAPEEETERELENEITRLQHETRMWRMSNHAFWIMWGVQKAKIPGLPDFDDPTQSAAVAAGPALHISMSSGTLPMVQSPIAEEEGQDPMNGAVKESTDNPVSRSASSMPQAKGEEEEEEDFNYLAYAWQRAMFFWGDAVGLGFIKKDELPEDVQKNMKVVEN